MLKKNIKIIIIVAFMAVFVLIPLKPSDLTVTMYLNELPVYNNAYIYYATTENPVFCDEQIVSGNVDEKYNAISFTFDGSLKNRIKQIRFDFPVTDEVLTFESVVISSAGVPKYKYTGSEFFGENVTYINDLDALDIGTGTGHAYSLAGGNDPYVILDAAVSNKMNKLFSRFVGTRLAACLIVAASLIISSKKREQDK